MSQDEKNELVAHDAPEGGAVAETQKQPDQNEDMEDDVQGAHQEEE